MPTINDIPSWLMYLDRRAEFKEWLKHLALDRGNRKKLMFIWSRTLETTWTGAEVLYVLGPE